MIVRTPATSLVAALDEPWRFMRDRFPAWAPPTFGIAALGVLPALVTQWFASGLNVAPESFDVIALGGVYAGGCGTILTYIAGQLGAFVIVRKVLDGERPGVGEALLGGLAPRMVLIGGGAMLLILMGFGCIVGGPILAGVFAFAPVALAARPGTWFSSLSDSVAVATRRVSPQDAGLPMWKLAAVGAIWYGVYAVTNQLATLPTAGWMLWHLVSTLGQGDFVEAMKVQAPFPVGATAAVLGAALRPFADLYLAAGATILWRDVARVRSGEDLEAVLGGRAG